eukprot:6587739-Prymnesium_polylepis.1
MRRLDRETKEAESERAALAKNMEAEWQEMQDSDRTRDDPTMLRRRAHDQFEQWKTRLGIEIDLSKERAVVKTVWPTFLLPESLSEAEEERGFEAFLRSCRQNICWRDVSDTVTERILSCERMSSAARSQPSMHEKEMMIADVQLEERRQMQASLDEVLKRRGRRLRVAADAGSSLASGLHADEHVTRILYYRRQWETMSPHQKRRWLPDSFRDAPLKGDESQPLK